MYYPELSEEEALDIRERWEWFLSDTENVQDDVRDLEALKNNPIPADTVKSLHESLNFIQETLNKYMPYAPQDTP